MHDYSVVNTVITDYDNEYLNYDPTHDRILSSEDLPYFKPDVMLDGPLTYKEGNPSIDPDARVIDISGTKADSLGKTEFSTDLDTYSVGWSDTLQQLDNNGYYTTSADENYFVMDIFFSDRLTGDIYIEKHPVFLDENVPVGEGSFYRDVRFNGVQDFGEEGDPTFDSAVLWATLTDGQVVLTEEALDMEAEDELWLEEAM